MFPRLGTNDQSPDKAHTTHGQDQVRDRLGTKVPVTNGDVAGLADTVDGFGLDWLFTDGADTKNSDSPALGLSQALKPPSPKATLKAARKPQKKRSTIPTIPEPLFEHAKARYGTETPSIDQLIQSAYAMGGLPQHGLPGTIRMLKSDATRQHHARYLLDRLITGVDSLFPS